jgi:multidrug efflux system membrane fusion protein
LTLNDAGELGVRYVDTNETVHFAPVTILRDSKDGVWVTGLPDQIRLITIGQEYVTDGIQVDVTMQEASL